MPPALAPLAVMGFEPTVADVASEKVERVRRRGVARAMQGTRCGAASRPPLGRRRLAAILVRVRRAAGLRSFVWEPAVPGDVVKSVVVAIND